MISSPLKKLLAVCLIITATSAKAQIADLCSSAGTLTVTTTCVTTSYTLASSYSAEIASTGCYSATTGNFRDGWFKFTTGASTTSVTVTATNTAKDMVVQVFSGTCGALTQIGCADATTSAGASTEAATVSVSASTTYYVRIIRKGTASNNMSGTICVSESATFNDQCTSAITVSCGGTYTGSTATATSTNDPTGTCGTSAGTPGVWYKFVGTGYSTTASLCGSSYDTKIQVYSGTCSSMTCVTGNDDYCSTASQVTFTSVLGTTYYIFVGGYLSDVGSYTLAITCAIPSAPNCATYTSPANASVLSCNAATLNWTAAATGGTPSDYLLYFGTNNPPTNISNGTSLGNVLTSTPSSLTPLTTYYWQIRPSNSVGTASGCSVYSFTTGSGTISNDICGGATPLTSGVTINDDNSCATDEAPMTAGTCWSTGTVNSLWYSIAVPASGTLGVLTTGGTLTNTQIAVYSGPCASTMTQVGCNDNAPAGGCSTGTTVNSQLNLSGLAAGTYYIRVDGRSANVGTYSILASTTGTVGTATPVTGQDCTAPTAVCANPMPVGNPGYSGAGNICDFDGANDCTSGELNSVWMQVSITTTGSLTFTIQPNDYTTCATGTDYDFLLWKMSGGGTTTTCSGIIANSGTALAACNYSYLGVTGVSATGNAATGYCATYDASFEPAVSVTAGDVYYLVVQNYSSSTSGFSLTFGSGAGAAGINTASPTSVLWTGGAGSTTWTATSNWGGCTAPNCSPGVDAIVAPSSSWQPTVTGTQNVKNLTINSGAVLTLAAGATLNVCGNLLNNGTITCGAGSVINFNGSGTQTVSGNLTGTSKFANFSVNKTAGTVSLLNNIECSENFTTSNSTSIVNINGVDVTIGGSFLNSNGTTTFTGITSTSMLTFNGTGTQTYNPTVSGGTNLTLNNVTINNTNSGYGDVILANSMLLSNAGSLTLTSGDIITSNYRVELANTATTANGSGNSTSFVNGNLRRYVTTSGTYEWPLGNSAKGYQRATTVLSSCTVGYFDARFDAWPSTPPTQGGTECATTYNLPAEDNGYWTITANTGTANYDMTLYPLNATNTSTAGGWTIMKAPTIAGTFVLNGTCVATSTASTVMRNGMSGFSVFGAAQAITPLPVELLYFRGKAVDKVNELEWATASESNNDHFDIERSADGTTFEKLLMHDGGGNSSVLRTYNDLDPEPLGQTTYYRLKQVDYNNDYSYSQVIAISRGDMNNNTVNVRPNPTTGNITVDLLSDLRTAGSAQILDYTGRVVSDQKLMLEAGRNEVRISMDKLCEGVYTLRIELPATGFISVTKVVKY